jgi:hypothetical protein
MSHISKIELQINDLEALKAACKRLGLIFKQGQTSFTWYNGKEHCDHAIQVPGANYEVGLTKSGQSYELMWDDWHSGGLVDRLNKDAGLLKQAYGVARVKAEARRKRYRVRETRTKTGIRLEVVPG